MSIDTSVDAGVATITINNPDALNAMDAPALEDLLSAVLDLSTQGDVRAIILTGAGDRAFIAGANIKHMATMNTTAATEFGRLGHAVGLAIERAPQPVIAAINGFALGGGCELALACDIRICSTTAVFAQPEVGLGIPPGWGGTQRLTRLVGKGIASELIFTGRRVNAEEALRIGLVNAVVEPSELLAKANEMAKAIAANAPQAVRLSKRLIGLVGRSAPEAGLDEEARLFASVFEGEEQREGMTAFVEKRQPAFGDLPHTRNEEEEA